MLHIHNLQKFYKGQHALAINNLVVQAPEIIGLYGHNGAGKSTFLNLLSGNLIATTGTWTFNNLTINTAREDYLKQVGYMPDDFILPPYLTLYEFLLFFAKLKKQPKEHVLETLVQVGLDHLKGDYTTKLSKGMRQRLLLAQAIIGKPRLLLLDEPTNGLDKEWSEKLKELIQTLHKNGTMIIISSHHHDFLHDICTMKFTLEEGRLTSISKSEIVEITR